MHCALEIRHAYLIFSHFSLLIVCCRGNSWPIVFVSYFLRVHLFVLINHLLRKACIDRGFVSPVDKLYYVSITWQVRKLPNNCLTLYCFPWFFLWCDCFFMATKKCLFIEIQFYRRLRSVKSTILKVLFNVLELSKWLKWQASSAFLSGLYRATHLLRFASFPFVLCYL